MHPQVLLPPMQAGVSRLCTSWRILQRCPAVRVSQSRAGSSYL